MYCSLELNCLLYSSGCNDCSNRESLRDNYKPKPKKIKIESYGTIFEYICISKKLYDEIKKFHGEYLRI